jgi:hypothetical protein
MYRINLHNYKTLGGIMAYTSTYIPALGEIVDITKDTTSVMGRVKQKIVKESPGEDTVFYLYVDLDDIRA